MNHKTVLLTGASGYLGQHLLWSWIHKPWDNDSDDDDNNNDERKRTMTVIALYHKQKGFAEAVERQIAIANDRSSRGSITIKVIPRMCNLMDPSDIDSLWKDISSSKIDVCVHMAALSSPQLCQQDPIKAREINVPKYFFSKLRGCKIIALSTDQVFDGMSDKLYTEEEDSPQPINVYGSTKLEMEETLLQLISEEEKEAEEADKKQQPSQSPTPNETVVSSPPPQKTEVIILRSSIILGPKAPISPDETHDTFVHFIATRKDQPTTFFTNEFRNVVSVNYVCQIISFFVTSTRPTTTTSMTTSEQQQEHQGTSSSLWNNNNNPSNNNNNPSSNHSSTNPQNHRRRSSIYHMGGPRKVHRLEIATTVFELLGYDMSVLLSAEQRNPTSPLDIGMDSQKLEQDTMFSHSPSTLKGMIEEIFCVDGMMIMDN